jgi:hypothetical protein
LIALIAFHQQRSKQKIVAKPAAAVKEEKHKNKPSVDFMCKNYIYLQFFVLDAS